MLCTNPKTLEAASPDSDSDSEFDLHSDTKYDSDSFDFVGGGSN